MQSYETRFKKFLIEADEPELTDREAMATTLDKGTSPEDFDVNAPEGVVGQLPPELTAYQQKMFVKLQAWIVQLDEFKEFLNGTDGGSMQSILNASSPETLFKKISDAETKKISRVAMELSSLIEILKGYLAGSTDAKYRGQ